MTSQLKRAPCWNSPERDEGHCELRSDQSGQSRWLRSVHRRKPPPNRTVANSATSKRPTAPTCAELVRQGVAISRRYEPDTSRNDTYDQLQADAEAAGAGLWAPDACGPATDDVSIGLEIRYDADGDDNVNKNDEWVRFTNNGTAPLDLDGSVVADESARHRYTFRNITLEVAASVTLFTGCGDDTATKRYWCNSGSAVWNNTGDTVFLRDPNGNNVLSETYAGN